MKIEKKVDFNKLREKTKSDIKKKFDDIESRGIEIPKELKELFEVKVDEVFPRNEKEAREFLKEFPTFFNSFFAFFEYFSHNMSKGCKKFIDKLHDDLFELTKGKGIDYSTWKHFNLIWYYLRVLRDIENTKFEESKLGKDLLIFLMSSFYVSIFELTLKVLEDYAVKIALMKRVNDRYAEKFLNRYNRASMKGRSVFKHDLIEFFRKEKYIVGEKCKIIENSQYRDKPSHAGFYYNPEREKLVIGNELVEVEELKKRIYELGSFYSYFIITYFRKSGLFRDIKRIFESIEKLEKR